MQMNDVAKYDALFGKWNTVIQIPEPWSVLFKRKAKYNAKILSREIAIMAQDRVLAGDSPVFGPSTSRSSWAVSIDLIEFDVGS
ncbi:hypothetical protein GCM10027027_08730 [Neomicrococcus lactis]